MAIEIAARTSDDVENPIVAKTAVHIDITGLDAFGHDEEGAAVQLVYRLFADGPQAARDDGWSHAFTPSQDGKHSWDGFVFPTDGSYTLRLYTLDADGVPDTEVATQAVTVVE